MKNVILLFFLMIYGCAGAQIRDEERPPPPRPIPPQVNLSDANKQVLQKYSTQIERENQDMNDILDSLKLIVLSDTTFHKLRFEAARLISQISTVEAETFLLDNIDLHAPNPFNLPQEYTNYPCYYHLGFMKNYMLFSFLNSNEGLGDCNEDKKLVLYLRLIAAYYYNVDPVALVKGLRTRAKGDCKKQNIKRMLEMIEEKRK